MENQSDKQPKPRSSNARPEKKLKSFKLKKKEVKTHVASIGEQPKPLPRRKDFEYTCLDAEGLAEILTRELNEESVYNAQIDEYKEVAVDVRTEQYTSVARSREYVLLDMREKEFFDRYTVVDGTSS